MDFRELILKRQSIRSYLDKKVEPEVIELCVEAGRMAPSACNAQPWRFVVVDDKNIKEEVAAATYSSLIAFNKFAVQAPVIIVIVMEPPKMSAKIGSKLTAIDYNYIDMGIAAEHICLQAADLGLGTCILGWFQQHKIKKILSIPKHKKVGLLITLGYSKETTVRDKKRKEKEEVCGYNKY